MNPTALNLLAVSVFAFTMLSLVGPLLNISPGAVAITLSGCAGVIALDRFTWQSKGLNLLLDLVSGQDSEYRQRIIYHEAGHFLVAHLLDIPVQSYTLSAWEGIKKGLPGIGGVVVEADDKDPAPLSRQQISRYCTIWMAGIAAETKAYGNAQGGEDDKRQLIQLWQQAKQIGIPTECANAETQVRWALLQAQTLLDSQSEAYDALVAAMTQRASVERCVQQIEANRVAVEV